MAKVLGFDSTIKILNSEIKKIKGRGVGGLLAAGFLLQAESDRHVPVEHGFLKASSYTRKQIENPLKVEVGYSAQYAIYVHENLERKLEGQQRPSGLGFYWGPKGESQFLLRAVVRKKKEMLIEIAKRAKIQ